MNTEGRGKLAVEIDSKNKFQVVFSPINGTVWKNRNELCELFGCYLKDINKSLKIIFEKNILRIEDTCRYHTIAGAKRIDHDISEVNLSVILALSFYIETQHSKILREWFLIRCLNYPHFELPSFDINQNYQLN
ncbi:hypothetical protein JGH11_01670 [Dysgonomonas sp. Marseille-P4677]|uniref:hypothetical protein n=1 Tax=Dysgonomonas sp. Marseille-P4677 TaxID=2364790 RepID=UPI001914D1F9|nr:hypothetical protein [Dysgonomonas sp. Marseille-P4677]MBK5719572.1 hypothetical protein [Dysgonomonas sp. Marseille-P4677]